MKATGMVRRMDELGRVVIPKEIRRTMHLHCGEELEIFAQDEGLYLRKYSALATLQDSAHAYVRVVESLAGNTVYVADPNAIMFGVGRHADVNAEGEPLSTAVIEVLEARKSAILSRISFWRGGIPYAHGMVCPLVAHGDLFGALLLGADNPIDSRQQGVMQAACCLLQQDLGE